MTVYIHIYIYIYRNDIRFRDYHIITIGTAIIMGLHLDLCGMSVWAIGPMGIGNGPRRYGNVPYGNGPYFMGIFPET